MSSTGLITLRHYFSVGFQCVYALVQIISQQFFFLKAGFPTLCADNLKGLQIIIPAIFHTHFRENGQQANHVPGELRGVQLSTLKNK